MRIKVVSNNKGKKHVLRFGIRDRCRRHRAATWNLWAKTGTGKSDVYLACRELRDSFKISLHESGRWRIAFSEPTFEGYVKGTIPKFKDRVIEKWLRPSNFAPGITLALSIVTPWSAVNSLTWSAVNSLIKKEEEDYFKGVIWLPSAPEPMASEIDILIAEPTIPVSGWPGKRSMGTCFIGSFPLENGDTIWAVYWFVDMPDFSSLPETSGQFFKGKSEEDLKNLKEGEARVFMAGAAPDGRQVIYDCAINVQTDEK